MKICFVCSAESIPFRFSPMSGQRLSTGFFSRRCPGLVTAGSQAESLNVTHTPESKPLIIVHPENTISPLCLNPQLPPKWQRSPRRPISCRASEGRPPPPPQPQESSGGGVRPTVPIWCAADGPRVGCTPLLQLSRGGGGPQRPENRDPKLGAGSVTLEKRLLRTLPLPREAAVDAALPHGTPGHPAVNTRWHAETSQM